MKKTSEEIVDLISQHEFPLKDFPQVRQALNENDVDPNRFFSLLEHELIDLLIAILSSRINDNEN